MHVEEIPSDDKVKANCTLYSTCTAARSCSKVVLTKIYHKDNPANKVYGYTVLDDQSNTCLGDPFLFEKLNIQGPEYDYELSTCSGHRTITKGRRASGLIVESLHGHKERLPTIIENENIPGDRTEIPTPELCKMFSHLKTIADCIRKPREDVKIVLLLGRNCPEPLKIRESRNGPRGTPWAQRTDLGWTVSGQMCMRSVNGGVQALNASVKRTVLQQSYINDTCPNHIQGKEILCSSYKGNTDIYIERTDDEVPALSVEDHRFVKILTESTHTNSKGNLEFPLPFKKDETRIPNNHIQAKRRLGCLLKTLKRKPEMMEEYQKFLGKIIAREHASPVPQDELQATPGSTWYLPHFAVHHPKKAKIRVVFDSSAEFEGISLNKTLLSGPDHMNSLIGILIRFRIGEVVVMGDIEQMFHNFYVNPEDRNFLRFLWYKDNDTTKPIIEYRMNVHLFGNISSPAVATFGLRTIANDCKETHGEDVKRFIHEDFYVDDGSTSLPDVQSAICLLQRSRDALSTKNLRFHKIVSNDIRVLQALPEGERAECIECIDLQNDPLPHQRSLGVTWDLDRDVFRFKLNLPDKPFSRRGVLSITSSIFDPMGFISPITIQGKLLLRQITAEKKDEIDSPQDMWDRPLPDRYLDKWNQWLESLDRLKNVDVKRCYRPPEFGVVKNREIHIFSDASNIAIGAVAYLRQIKEHNQPYVSFLLAKAKVTPTHAVSIPRLELCAAVLATTFAQTICSELGSRMKLDSTTFYTDSKVVLGYISKESKRFHTYVTNRVHKINTLSKPCQWHHVPTDQNAADIASRSVPASHLNSTIWFKGPSFLWQEDCSLESVEEHHPNTQYLLSESDPELRKQANVNATSLSATNITKSHLGCERFSRFSTWISLRRAIATIIVKARTFKSGKPKTVGIEELQLAEISIITAVQKEHFQTEIDNLKKNVDSGSSDTVKKDSPLYQLSPFLDEIGIIRVGGRLRRSDLDLGGRHPVLLPKQSHVSKLIAEHFHNEVQHQGRHTTFAAIRSGGKWIIGAHDLVRSIINQCTICRKLRGKLLTQIMADLPKDRVETTPPFTNVGMDVFGPWNIMIRKTRGRTEAKRWAVLFTCLCSRAVHIEIIESMDTSSFILALRRFISLRDPVTRLRCDRERTSWELTAN